MVEHGANGELSPGRKTRVISAPLRRALLARQGRFREAQSSFERALSLARRLSHPYEEAKATANLGRLALQVKDYPHALVKLQQALAAMSRLGAIYDALALYHDLGRLFLDQGDYARAEEMSALREREAGRIGYIGVQLYCHEEGPRAGTLLAKREKEKSEKLLEPLPLPLQRS